MARFLVSEVPLYSELARGRLGLLARGAVHVHELPPRVGLLQGTLFLFLDLQCVDHLCDDATLWEGHSCRRGVMEQGILRSREGFSEGRVLLAEANREDVDRAERRCRIFG